MSARLGWLQVAYIPITMYLLTGTRYQVPGGRYQVQHREEADSRLLPGDRLTLMSARLGWLVGSLGSPECPVHIHLPYPPDPNQRHSGICIILPIRCCQPLPCQKANCQANPLLFLSPLLIMGSLSGCFDCLRGKQGQSETII